MTAIKSLVISDGTTRQIPDTSSLLVGTGIDRNTDGDLTIGGTTATSITLGSATTQVSILGDLDVAGVIGVVNQTTFQQDATFEGNVSFGSNPSDNDTVSFANATINSDITFNGAGHQVKNLAVPVDDADAATKKYTDDGLDLKVDLAGDTMTGSLTMSNSATVTGLPAASADSDAVSKSYAEDYFLGGAGSHTLLVQDGGQFATVQDAVDAAVDGDVILVGPKAAGWGSISITSAKKLTIASYAQSATGQKLCRVSGVDINIATGSDPNLCEINIAGLYIGGSVADGAALVRFTGAGSARLRMRQCGIFKSGAGDAVESSNSGSGSSFYVEDCFINTQGVDGTTLKHVSGFTQVQGRSTLVNGAVVASCSAGDLVIVGSQLSAGATSAGPALQASGGTFTIGNSSVSFPKASGVGASVSSGAILGVDQVSFLIGTGAALATGKAITGAGTLVLGEATFGPALVYSSVVDATTTPAVKAGGALNSALSMSPNGGTTKLKITDLADGTAANDAINLSQLSAIESVSYQQELFVAKNGSDSTGTGAVLKPFASVTAAMAAITDASPTNRYAIRVEAGAYTEAGALNIKPNVFIVGASRDSVRITATSFGLDASFTGGADNRSGFSNVSTIGAHDYNFTTVTSTAGKLYFRDVTFTWTSSPAQATVTLTGYNNAIVQAQFSGCQFFNVFTVQGVNVGVFNDNICWGNIVLTQSPFGGVPTILAAAGGFCAGDISATTTVDDFNRRCAMFLRGFPSERLTVDGASAYIDYTLDSGGRYAPIVSNGGNLVLISRVAPATNSTTNNGDWGNQWLFAFNYVNVSSGTDLYVGSVDSAYDADGSTAGYSVYVQPDQYGLQENVNGGLLDLRTANATGSGISGDIAIATGTSVDGDSGDVTITTGAPSGTGTRGVITLDGAQVDVKSKKIVNLADGVNPNDAVNKSQLDAIVAGVSDVTATAPLLSSGGATPDISIDTAGASSGDVLTFDGSAWAAAAPAVTAPAGADTQVQFNNSGSFGASANLTFDATNGVLEVVADAAATNGPLRLSNLDGVFVDTSAVEAKLSVLEPLGTGYVDLSGANGVSVSADGTNASTLSFDGITSASAAFDIEAASSVTATITGGATYLLTPDSIDALTYAASVALDFDPSLPALKTVTLTGDITFSSSNLGASRNISVRIIGDTVSRNLVFPAGWTWLGGATPTVLEGATPPKVAILSLASFSNDNANVVASWSYDGSDVVTDVTASGPLASSGGATPDISFPSWPADASGALTNDGSGNLLWVSAPAAVDYSVVDITTAVSQGDAVTVAGVAAIATAAASSRVAGMVSATANKVSVLGIIEDCNFEGSLTLAAGEAVYLSASSEGKLTNVAPSSSGEVVAELGIIVTVNTVGGGAAAADVLWQPKSIVVL